MESDPSFDLAASELRGDGQELAVSMEVLAAKLEQALPGRALVERRGGGLLGRGTKRVRSVEVALADCRYQLVFNKGRLEGTRMRQSGGIAIKRETLEPGAWLAALTDELREEAQRSTEARAALERLLA
jgi:hypothetical protein